MGCTYCVPHGKKGAFPRNGSLSPRTLREKNRKTTSPKSLGRPTPTADEREECGRQNRTGLRYFRLRPSRIEIFWGSHNSFKFETGVRRVQPRHGCREYGFLYGKTTTKTKLNSQEVLSLFFRNPNYLRRGLNAVCIIFSSRREETTFRFVFLICIFYFYISHFIFYFYILYF